MIITEQQIHLLKRILQDEADALLASNDAMKILDALNELYITLLDEEFEPTEASRECERLRDHIHWDNFNLE